jgi:hypothetical protein
MDISAMLKGFLCSSACLITKQTLDWSFSLFVNLLPVIIIITIIITIPEGSII